MWYVCLMSFCSNNKNNARVMGPYSSTKGIFEAFGFISNLPSTVRVIEYTYIVYTYFEFERK